MPRRRHQGHLQATGTGFYATSNTHGNNYGNGNLEARSLRSQRINGNYIVTGCDFSEHKDTSHIARALSFERKPSIRSFRVGQTPPVLVETFPRRTALSRSNAFKLGPFQYIKYVFARMRMRMRMRRRSPVMFKHQNFARKRSYLLNASTSSYQYRVKTRDLLRRHPKVQNRGVSGPFNVMHGAQALAAAEQGKNQTFDILTKSHHAGPATINVPVGHKQLPTRRVSQRPPSAKASLVLPDPPEVGNQLQDFSESEDGGFDDIPELVPSRKQYHRQQQQQQRYSASSRAPTRPTREDPDDVIDIEDALDFVNAWGSYLQKMVASRVIKDRQAKLKELEEEDKYVNYDESDDSSIYSEEAPGVYDSCTSECFAASEVEDNTSSTLRSAKISPLPPMPPPHVPHTSSRISPQRSRASPPRTITNTSPIRPSLVRVSPPPAPRITQRVSSAPSNPQPRTVTPPRRRVSGPRPMTTEPLQYTPRRGAVSPGESPARETPPISVHRSRLSLAARKQSTPDAEEFDFSSGNEQSLNTSWVAKSASPASKSSKRLSRQNAVLYESLTPSHTRHSHKWSNSSNESASAQLLAQYTDPLVQWSSSGESVKG